MGALSDIFAAVRLQLDGTGFEAQATALADRSGKNVGTRMSNQLNAKLKSSILQGVGLGAGISGFNMLSSAISGTIGLAGDVVNAGMEEEASISHLGASLEANIPNWDGNTAAIERVIASQIKLGFSDEEQRASLALLVGATHDVTKALEIQRTAMDLARYETTQGKVVSLMDATEALTKVEAGSYRILKGLGIVLKDNATQQDALNAVQAVANGQALEYTKTVEGKLLVAQTMFGEKMDELGSKSLPLVSEGLDVAIQGMDAAIPVVEGLAEVVDGLDSALADVGGVGGTLDIFIKLLRAGMGDPALALQAAAAWRAVPEGIGKGIGKAHDDVVVQTGRMRADFAQFGRTSATSIGTVTSAADRMGLRFRDNATAVKNAALSLTTYLGEQAQALISGYWDPIIAADDLRVQKDQVNANLLAVNAAKAALALTKPGTAARKQAQLDYDQAVLTLDQSVSNLDKTKANLLTAGTLSAKDQSAWLTDLQKRWKTSTGAMKTSIGSFIDMILEMQRVAKTPITIRTRFASGFTQRAAGGPVVAGTPYTINERAGQQEFLLHQGVGYILPRVPQAIAAGGAGGGPITVNVNVTPGRDTSLQAARNFGQATADAVASIFREQTARSPI